MKGVVFTEFLEMVEEQFGYEMVDEIIVKSKVPSGGSYTAVGTYDHSEMISLVMALHHSSEISVSDLLKSYGQRLFGRFHNLYPQFFDGEKDALTFLEYIDSYIHVEVLKLYPDAQLPRFISERVSDKQLVMTYKSDRKMADFAHGLILGCLSHFKEDAQVEIINMNEDGSLVNFVITKP